MKTITSNFSDIYWYRLMTANLILVRMCEMNIFYGYGGTFSHKS